MELSWEERLGVLLLRSRGGAGRDDEMISVIVTQRRSRKMPAGMKKMM